MVFLDRLTSPQQQTTSPQQQTTEKPVNLRQGLQWKAHSRHDQSLLNKSCPSLNPENHGSDDGGEDLKRKARPAWG